MLNEPVGRQSYPTTDGLVAPPIHVRDLATRARSDAAALTRGKGAADGWGSLRGRIA